MALADLSPQELERVVRTIEEISRSVDRIVEVIPAFAKRFKVDLEEGQKSLKKIDDQVVSLQQRGQKFTDMQGAMWRDFKAQAREASVALEQVYRTAGVGVSSLARAGGSFLSSMMSGPMGTTGLVGMMFHGLSTNERFRSTAAQIGYTLQAVGGIGKKELGAINTQVHQLYAGWGSMGEELQGTLTAFAQFNVGAKAFEKTNEHARGFMSNIAGIATAMDKMGSAAAGTTAKLIGETMMSAGVSIQEAKNQVIGLAASLREAGLNYTQFAGGIVQANSALRMQNQSLNETRQIFDGIRKQLEARGIGAERAGQMAMEKLQAGSQALGGLSPGIAGVVGQALARQGNQNFQGMNDPVAIMMRMRVGVEKGGDSSFMGPAFKALADMMKKAVGTSGDPEQDKLRAAFALEKVGGMSPQAALAIIEGAKASEALITPAETTAKYVKEMDGTFKRFEGTANRFDQTMKRIELLTAQFGTNLLAAITIGFVTIGEYLSTSWIRFKDVLGLDLSSEEAEDLQRSNVFINKMAMQSEASWTGMGDALKGIYKEVKDVSINTIQGNLGTTMTEISAYNRLRGAHAPPSPGNDPVALAEQESNRIGGRRGGIRAVFKVDGIDKAEQHILDALDKAFQAASDKLRVMHNSSERTFSGAE